MNKNTIKKAGVLLGAVLLVLSGVLLDSLRHNQSINALSSKSAFGSVLTLATSNSLSQEVVTADFNNDGNRDIAAVGPSDIYVFLGNGDGTFSSPVVSLWHPSAYSESAGGVVTADLNGDGNEDIVVGDSTGGLNYVALGNGDGSFGDGTGDNYNYTSGGTVAGLVKADFNHDGNVDVADLGISFGNTNLVIDYGAGDGTFSSNYTNSNGSNNYRVLAVGDLNEDGWDDIVAGNSSTNQVSVFLNNGSGAFPSKSSYSEGSTNVSMTSITIADFDGDGHQDVAVVNNDDNSISILKGAGDGTLGSPTEIRVGTDPMYITSADFNGDGSPDIAVTSDNASSFGSVEIWDNDSSGKFTEDSTISLPQIYYGTIVADDFNGDGDLDIATGNPDQLNSTSSNVSVSLNKTSSACYD